MDGFAIGAAFQAGSSVGIVVAVAVIAHDFADGFNTFTIANLYGNNRRRAITLLAADAVAPVVGASITLLFTWVSLPGSSCIWPLPTFFPRPMRATRRA
jgi:ZIP family zinc transporter